VPDPVYVYVVRVRLGPRSDHVITRRITDDVHGLQKWRREQEAQGNVVVGVKRLRKVG
jgi:hypothetical protein